VLASVATLDPALADALAGAAATDSLEVIVNFDAAATTTDALTEQVLDLGAGVIQFNNFSMLAALATPAQITALAGLEGVTGVYLNRRLDYYLHESIPTIRADAVHVSGVTGRGVGVAILDTGIDGLYNPDVAFPGRTVQNVKAVINLRDLFTFRGQINRTIRKGAQLFVEDQANSDHTSGHGTHVAGIAAGNGAASGGYYTGVAPGANLIGIGTGDVLFIFWALAGFDWLLDNRREYNIQVVNNSWGTNGPFDPDDPINEATREVHDRGVAVVFAAGNCGTGDEMQVPFVSCPPPDESQLNPYSVAPWTIGVAAGCKLVTPDPTISAVHCDDPTGAGRNGILADFSSRGLPTGNELHEPDITAPGVHVVSDRASTGTTLNVLDANHDLNLTSTCAISAERAPFYTCASGTSMAAPHIVGVIALMEEASGGTLTPDQALDVLKRTARPLPGFFPFEVGAGYVDAWAAVQAVRR
jgi:serine protease AprX